MTMIVNEMLASSNMAFAMYPGLTQGAIAALLHHATDKQKKTYLPKMTSGEWSGTMNLTEPHCGTDLGLLRSKAVPQGDGSYRISGQKIFISRVKQSDLMLLLARTTPYDELKDKTQGISVFLVDLRDIKGKLEVQPLDIMVNHHTNTVFFEDVEVPVANLIGEEGKGFRYIIDGWNAERILVAAEAIGDGRWFVERASRYATNRIVF